MSTKQQPENSVITTEKPRLCEIEVSQTAVSDQAQREFNQGAANKISSEWDRNMVGTVVASLRDGKYYLVDGQHRVHVLRDREGEKAKVSAWVYTSLTVKQEALMYLKYNNRTEGTAMDKHHIAVAGGKPLNVAVEKLIRNAGYNTSLAKGQNNIGCIDALLRVYERGGHYTLERTLFIIGEGLGSAGFVTGIVRGVGLVVARYSDHLDETILIDKLDKLRRGPKTLLQAGKDMADQHGKSLEQGIATVLVDMVNAGRGGKKLTPWRNEAA